jgi:hypothetical protein
MAIEQNSLTIALGGIKAYHGIFERMQFTILGGKSLQKTHSFFIFLTFYGVFYTE